MTVTARPTTQRSLDYDTTFTFNGGTLYVAGSSGNAPDASTNIYRLFISYVFSSKMNASTLVELVSSDGTTIMSITPGKSFSAVIFGGDAIKNGETYQIRAGGEVAGSVTVSSTVTTGGKSSGGMGGGGFFGGGGGGRR